MCSTLPAQWESAASARCKDRASAWAARRAGLRTSPVPPWSASRCRASRCHRRRRGAPRRPDFRKRECRHDAGIGGEPGEGDRVLVEGAEKHESVGLPIERALGEESFQRADLASEQSRPDQLPGIGRTGDPDIDRQVRADQCDQLLAASLVLLIALVLVHAVPKGRSEGGGICRGRLSVGATDCRGRCCPDGQRNVQICPLLSEYDHFCLYLPTESNPSPEKRRWQPPHPNRNCSRSARRRPS